jgi:hypothetical protein
MQHLTRTAGAIPAEWQWSYTNIGLQPIGFKTSLILSEHKVAHAWCEIHISKEGRGLAPYVVGAAR